MNSMLDNAKDQLQIGDEGRQGSVIYVTLACFVAALGGLLFGYDTAVIAGAVGFLKKHFDLSPAWVGWSTSCALFGCMVGVAMAGTLSDRLGRKKVMILSAIFFLISALGTALPRNLTEFIIFRIIGGIGVGAASITSPMYIAEISPARIRGRMVSINQFAIVSGMLIVYFVNYFIAHGQTEDWNVRFGWRWMFGSGTLPSFLLLALLFFVPESPRWLTQKGLAPRALEILSRVGGRSHAQTELAAIQDAISHETGSIRQLFEPGLRVVFVMGVVLAVLQQVTGINVFLYYAPEIIKKLETTSDSDVALLQTVIVGAVNMAFTIIAIWTVDRLGRKPLMMLGSAGMAISLFALGAAAYYQKTELWVLVFILGYIASFAMSVGPVTWVILSEIFPTRIRGRAMGIATLCLWGANFVVSQTFPMMNENPVLVEKFHHGLPFCVYGVLSVVLLIFVGMVVPETKGKSLEEIEKMWLK
jgi:sugar porter (SP) family MFS transporter